MKIENRLPPEKPILVDAYGLPIGEVFVAKVVDGDVTPRVLLRAYGEIVDLADPNMSWNLMNRGGPVMLREYRRIKARLIIEPLKGTE